MQSVSKSMNHVQLLEQDYNKLNNNNIPYGIGNKIGNSLAPITDYIKNISPSQSMSGRVQAVDTDIGFLAPELAQSFKNNATPTIPDIAEQKGLVNHNMTPNQMKSYLESTIHGLEGKFQPQVDAYNRTMGTNKTISDFMQPESKAIFDRISAGGALTAPAQSKALQPTKTIVQTGMYGGKKVNKYSDGSTGYAN